MEFWIAFGVTFALGMLYIAGKKHNKANPSKTAQAYKTKPSKHPKDKLTQEDEELITVILPTINHPK